MKDYLYWSGQVDHLVLQSWHIESPYGFFAGLVFALSVAFLNQLISGVRAKHEIRALGDRRRLISDIIAARTAASQTRQIGHPSQHIANLERQQAQLSKRPKTGSFLFGLQSITSAVVMLILMTFNGYLILAVALGSALGYHYFAKGQDASHC